MEQNKKYTPDDVAALVLNMRYCCGDIEIDEDSDDDCSYHCLDCRDQREERLRFCSDWLMSTAADLIEGLYAELQAEREHHEFTYLHAEAFRKKIEALKAKYEADE